jgi:hypothetical protein
MEFSKKSVSNLIRSLTQSQRKKNSKKRQSRKSFVNESLSNEKNISSYFKQVVILNQNIDHIGKSIIAFFNDENIELLNKIQKSTVTDSFVEKTQMILKENPELTSFHISLSYSFLALIYKNKEVYYYLNKILKKEKLNSLTDEFIEDEIQSIYITPAEIVGGYMPRFKISSGMWAIITGMAVMFYYYIARNQIEYMAESLQNNKAFILMKDIQNLPVQCDLNKIKLPFQEQSILNIMNLLNPDMNSVNLIEMALKYRECIYNPNSNVQSEILNNVYQYRYDNNNSKDKKAGKYFSTYLSIAPNVETETQLVESSTQLVKQSSTIVHSFVSTTALTKTIQEYNKEVYEHIQEKVLNDLEGKEKVEDVVLYIDNILEKSPQQLHNYFFDENPSWSQVNMDTLSILYKDFTNIMSSFTMDSQKNIYKTAIQSLAGMNIQELFIRELQKKLIVVKSEIEHTQTNTKAYMKTLIIDISEIVAFIGSIWFLLQKMFYVFCSFLTAVAALDYKLSKKKTDTSPLALTDGPLPIEDDSNK